MSTGFSCHPILEVSLSTSTASVESLDQDQVQFSGTIKKSPSQPSRPTLRVRRPFKYLKHRGPRPIAASSPTFYWDIIFNNSVQLHRASSHQMKLLQPNQERCPFQHSLKLERQSNKDNLNHKTNRKSDTSYTQSTSRLLRSRKLKLSALNVTNSSSSSSTATPHSRFEVINEDIKNPLNLIAIYHSKTAGMVPSSSRTPQVTTSCFSDCTTSAPNSSRHSLTLSESSHQSFPPITPRERDGKKRISDGTLMFARDKSMANNHTRSFSDFGISVSSTTALKKFSG